MAEGCFNVGHKQYGRRRHCDRIRDPELAAIVDDFGGLPEGPGGYGGRERQGEAVPLNEQSPLLNLNYGHSIPAVQRPYFKPKNCRGFYKLAAVGEDVSCPNLHDDHMSQFQLYCRENVQTARDQIAQMQFPIVVRFFDNYDIPGYAVLVSQSCETGRYYGEAYWMKWRLPYWMSLPMYFLDDSQKRHLTLIWIARQRLNHDVYRFQKLSILLSTYYPSCRQFQQRRMILFRKMQEHRQAEPEPFERNPRQHELYNLYAFQSNLNPRGTRPVRDILTEPLAQHQIVYVINGGKGADLARNKNMYLSMMLQNGQGERQINIPSCDWLTQPFTSRDGQHEYMWTDTYAHTGQRPNRPEVLQAFLDYYEDAFEQIVAHYQRRLEYFLGLEDIYDLGRLFSTHDPEEWTDPFRDQLGILLQAKDEQILQQMQQMGVPNNAQGRRQAISQIVDFEIERLLGAILQDYIAEYTPRWNSSSTQIRRDMT